MEHRLSIRTPLTMNISIYHDSVDLLQGHTLNISRHGVFVHIGPRTLPLYAMVEVDFPYDTSKPGITLQRTPAMVVRLDKQGIGLMFADEISSVEDYY